MRAKKTDLRSYVFTEANARWKLIYHLDFHLNLPLIYLEGVQEGFYVTKELFHGRLLNVQTEKFDEFLVHCGHVFVHLNKNIDLILGAAIKTVRAVKEKNCIWPCHAFGNIKEKGKLSCGTVYYSAQGGSTFWVFGWNPKVWPFKWEFLSNNFLWYCILCYARWFYLLSLWTKSWGATIQIGATKLYFSVLLNVLIWCTKPRGGSRGRVQRVRTPLRWPAVF